MIYTLAFRAGSKKKITARTPRKNNRSYRSNRSYGLWRLVGRDGPVDFFSVTKLERDFPFRVSQVEVRYGL